MQDDVGDPIASSREEYGGAPKTKGDNSDDLGNEQPHAPDMNEEVRIGLVDMDEHVANDMAHNGEEDRGCGG